MRNWRSRTSRTTRRTWPGSEPSRLATTRRTWSDFLGAFCPLPPEPGPDQVAVREQEAECKERQRGQAAEPAPDRKSERRAERQRQQQPGQPGTQLPADGGRKEKTEEQKVRQAQIRGGRLAGNREREREVREHLAVLVDDHLGRPAPHGVRVDPGNDQRDQYDPVQRFEV